MEMSGKSLRSQARPVRVTLIRHPALGLVYEPFAEGRRTYPHQVVLDTAPISQLTLASILGRGASEGIGAEISLIDMRKGREGQEIHSEEYRSPIGYASGRMRCFKVFYPNPSEFRSRIRDSDVICLTATFTTEANIIKDVISSCKGANPAAKIIVGGKDATARPSSYLSAGADEVVQGYGANAQKAIFGLPAGADFEVYPFPALDHMERQYFGTYGDHSPPGTEDPSIYAFFSQGCANACRFCTTAGERYRFLALDQVLERLGRYRDHGIRVLSLHEDNLLLRMDRRFDGPKGRQDIISMMRAIRDMGFAVEFGNGLQMGLLLSSGGRPAPDHELISELFQHHYDGERLVGAFRLHMPLETFESKTRRSQGLAKLPSREDLNLLLEPVSRMRIPQIVFGIILFYDTTLEQVHAIKERCLELRKIVLDRSDGETQVYFSVFNEVFLPGTRNFADPERAKRVIYPLEKYPELWGTYTPAYDGACLPLGDLFRLRRRLAIQLNTNYRLARGPPAWVRDKKDQG